MQFELSEEKQFRFVSIGGWEVKARFDFVLLSRKILILLRDCLNCAAVTYA